MKRLNFLQSVVGLFSFKTIADDCGNEYVVFDDSTITPEILKNISDKTEFEALENHVHLLEKTTKKEFENGDEVSNVDIVYICKDYSGELHCQPGEVDDLKYFEIDKIPDNISKPIEKALKQYIASKVDLRH